MLSTGEKSFCHHLKWLPKQNLPHSGRSIWTSSTFGASISLEYSLLYNSYSMVGDYRPGDMQEFLTPKFLHLCSPPYPIKGQLSTDLFLGRHKAYSSKHGCDSNGARIQAWPKKRQQKNVAAFLCSSKVM